MWVSETGHSNIRLIVYVYARPRTGETFDVQYLGTCSGVCGSQRGRLGRDGAALSDDPIGHRGRKAAHPTFAFLDLPRRRPLDRRLPAPMAAGA